MISVQKIISRKIMRVAIIGGGINSAVGRAHVAALKIDGFFKIVAGSFSRNNEVNMSSAVEYGVDISRVYSDHKQLISSELGKIDAIIVLTPTSLHTIPVLDALNAGIPVICEKTLTANIKDTQLVSDTLISNKGFLAVTYNYSGYPAVRELRELINSGQIGEVLHFAVEMPQEGYLRTNLDGKRLQPQNWRQADEQIPVIYLDLGSHLYQLSSYILGVRPRSVFATEQSCGFYPVVDSVSALVKYERGIIGNFMFGKTMIGYRNGLKIRIFGTKAALEWTQSDPECIKFSYADGRIELRDRGVGGSELSSSRYARFKAGHPAGYIEAFANLYVDIYHALIDYDERGAWSSTEVFGSEHSLEGLKFIQSMHQSANSASVIEIG
ncbi:Gfo/Idh/MocA family oxidoreductase [Polynucleobacter sp. AP-Capit-er-40B-B4]|uniref:Gfo/Idh/MocA family protein n=1 Tax=Polynucleobacter sp. AP-Capit-er-40B-B4 TaxID=2576927 RepID=UPI001C0E7C3F|nr:Gfo/Idh/MocA family oxidoreductase [Polynucleobacter sp. AP-Capit-er-40B-B4]MBU3580981.1 Gfo/Idh/MocA family oxidoreductase [Polynucleobacter sp. AP-Capit-er-40B-B4]